MTISLLCSSLVTFALAGSLPGDPTFTAGGDIQCFEDAGIVDLPGWASDIDFGGGTNPSFVINVDQPSLFTAAPTLDVNSGNLSFQTSDDANGVANLTVQLVTDQGQSAQASIVFRLDPVNDEPSFVCGGPVGVHEDSGLCVERGWATGMSAGPVDEDGQRLNFTVLCDNPGLFAIQPSLDAQSGDLSFAVADEQNGVANLTVILSDGGGSANGGDPFSQPGQGIVSVLAVNDPPLAGLSAGWMMDSLGLFNLYGSGMDDLDTREGDSGSSQNMIMEATLSCNSGTLSLPDAVGVVNFLVGDGYNDALMVMEGTQAGLNQALGHLVYAQDPSFGGEVIVTVSIDDRGNFGVGGPMVAGDNSSLSVNPALGVASPYDIFSLGSTNIFYSQVHGRVAGGGPVFLHQFSVATDSDLQSRRKVVVSGGDLRMQAGIVGHGNAVYCDRRRIDQSVTFLDSSRKPFKKCHIDFAQAEVDLSNMSAGWGLLPPNGTNRFDNGVLRLTGSDPDLNVFTVSRSLIEQARLIVIWTPPGSYGLVNVTGGSLLATEWGMNINRGTRRGVLFNVFQASRLHLENTNFDASLLAPDADVSLSQMHMAGNVVAELVRFVNISTGGERLAGEPFTNPPQASWDGDSSGVDAYAYTLTWTPDSPTEQIVVSRPSPEVLEIHVDGQRVCRQRYEGLSRLVFVGRSDYSNLTIAPEVDLPVELSGLAPVGYDDTIELAAGSGVGGIDVLSNDLAGPAALDPSSVVLVDLPSRGTASVDPSTGLITYQTDPLMAGHADFVDVFSYRAADVAANQTSLRRILVRSGGSSELDQH